MAARQNVALALEPAAVVDVGRADEQAVIGQVAQQPGKFFGRVHEVLNDLAGDHDVKPLGRGLVMSTNSASSRNFIMSPMATRDTLGSFYTWMLSALRPTPYIKTSSPERRRMSAAIAVMPNSRPCISAVPTRLASLNCVSEVILV